MATYDTDTTRDVVYTLGVAGLTTTNPFTHHQIIELLAESIPKTGGSKSIAKDIFHNTRRWKDYFEKTADGGYIFSESGYAAYQHMDQSRTQLKSSEAQLDAFFNIKLAEEMEAMHMSGQPIIEVPFKKISSFLPPAFSELLTVDPDECIEKLESALTNNTQFNLAEYDSKPVVEITGFSEPPLEIEAARLAINIGNMIEVVGRITVQSQTRPKPTTSAFECLLCHEVTYIDQLIGGSLQEPLKCNNEYCGRRGPFKLMGRPETTFVDSQVITVESLKGQVELKVALREHQCEPPWVRDGKVVRVVGQLRHTAEYQQNGKKSSEFEYILVANSIRFADDSITSPPTKDEIKLFDSWAKNPPELREKINSSMAPHIHGYSILKDALSLSHFSDWNWELDPHDVVVRSSIHILILGDPGIAKSQLVRDAVYLAPKSKWVDAVTSTKGGLANSALQVNGEWLIKAGALSHADKGLLGLDEMDKFPNKDDLSCFLSVLELQRQVVSKVGLSEITFNGRTAVLATANPRDGHLDPHAPLNDQISFPSPILQRFDLIFVERDVTDKEHDESVSEAILSIHRENGGGSRKSIERPIPVDLFRKYVLYARTKPVPKLNAVVEKTLQSFYLNTRKASPDNPNISARTFNNVVRIARAIARRELAPEITDEHAKHAIFLIKESLRSQSFGESDMTVADFGATKSQRDRIKYVRDAIAHLCKSKKSASIEDIAFHKGMDVTEVEHTINSMRRSGVVFRQGDGWRLNK